MSKALNSFRQHHRGHPPTSVWVFSLVDTSHKPALGVMQVVAQRDAATPLPLV